MRYMGQIVRGLHLQQQRPGLLHLRSGLNCLYGAMLPTAASVELSERQLRGTVIWLGGYLELGRCLQPGRRVFDKSGKSQGSAYKSLVTTAFIMHASVKQDPFHAHHCICCQVLLSVQEALRFINEFMHFCNTT